MHTELADFAEVATSAEVGPAAVVAAGQRLQRRRDPSDPTDPTDPSYLFFPPVSSLVFSLVPLPALC